ncbi:hypothetical protein KAU11_02710 [Candidatus Babeliales bacterium]|nr:hypothetical protein [Candidatus Babeliales bacterium]
MQKNVCTSKVLLVILTTLFSLSTQTSTKKFIKGAIVSKTTKHTEGHPVFFAGYRVTTGSGGIFTIPLDTEVKAPFYLLISEHLESVWDRGNTLQSLQPRSGEPYLLFTVSHQTQENGKLTLITNQISLDTPGLYIPPERCLAIPLNPSCVKNVEQWNTSFGNQFVPFPQIILNDKEVQHKNLKKQSASVLANNSVMKTLDQIPFHEPSTAVKKRVFNKKKQAVEISMMC